MSTIAVLASTSQETLQIITEKLPIGSSARQQFSAVALAHSETLGGFATNHNTTPDPYADPSVSPMLSDSDYHQDDFAKGHVFLYVKFNVGSTTPGALVSTFVSQTLEILLIPSAFKNVRRRPHWAERQGTDAAKRRRVRTRAHNRLDGK